MKKFFAVLGGLVAATSIVAVAVVILKKIKLSFSIECADEISDFEESGDDRVSVSIEDEEKAQDEALPEDDEIFTEEL